MSGEGAATCGAAKDGLQFLAGDSEMAQLYRAFDWASSPAGAPQDWPQALRISVRLILNTRHPMYIFWGPESICFYNDAYRETLGPERHPGSIGQPARQVWAEIWDVIGPQIDYVLAGEGSIWHEDALVPVTRFGAREDVYWTYSYSPIDDIESAGEIGGVLVVTTETTAKVLATKALVDAQQRADAASHAKSEFLTHMSHEIRTPMNAVTGLARLLSVSSPLTPKQQQFIATLQTSADSLLLLINQFLDLSRIEARAVDLENRTFHLAEVIQDVITVVMVQAEAKNLTIEIDDSCREKRTYCGDAGRIRQILANLCSNAVKFTLRGSVCVKVSCRGSGEENVHDVDIQVRDSGIGIPADRLGDIFTEFSQADRSISRRFGGTGLGLAISQSLAKLMGGSISATSEIDKGSTFTLSLPLQVVSPEISEQVNAPLVLNSPSAEESDRPRVLLVEDDTANALVASTFITSFGYSVDEVDNGIDAIECLKRVGYKAVIMDIEMKGLDGLETTRLIRAYEAHKGLSPLPILGMTACAFDNDRDRCIAAGMTDYMSKPFDPDELRLKLGSYISV